MHRRDLVAILAVAVGGAIGGALRWWVDSQLPWPGPPELPVGIALINAVGCLIIGIVVALVVRWRVPAVVRPFLAAGVLGGFTTFSAFALQGYALLRSGAPEIGMTYIIGSVVIGTMLARLGMSIGSIGARR